MHKISSVANLTSSGGSFTVQKRVNFDYNRSAFARQYRTWPILKRPQADVGQNIITNENGRLFSLSIRLVPDYETLFSYHNEFFDGITSLGVQLAGPPPPSGTLPQGTGRTGFDGVPKRFTERNPDLDEPFEGGSLPSALGET
jgi:hypothetical protein